MAIDGFEGSESSVINPEQERNFTVELSAEQGNLIVRLLVEHKDKLRDTKEKYLQEQGEDAVEGMADYYAEKINSIAELQLKMDSAWIEQHPLSEK